MKYALKKIADLGLSCCDDEGLGCECPAVTIAQGTLEVLANRETLPEVASTQLSEEELQKLSPERQAAYRKYGVSSVCGYVNIKATQRAAYEQALIDSKETPPVTSPIGDGCNGIIQKAILPLPIFGPKDSAEYRRGVQDCLELARDKIAKLANRETSLESPQRVPDEGEVDYTNFASHVAACERKHWTEKSDLLGFQQCVLAFGSRSGQTKTQTRDLAVKGDKDE